MVVFVIKEKLKEVMSTQKVTAISPAMSGRIKKYDSYSQRGGSIIRSHRPATQRLHTQESTSPISQSSPNLNDFNVIQELKNSQHVNKLTSNPKKYSDFGVNKPVIYKSQFGPTNNFSERSIVNNSRINSSTSITSEIIAIKAVADAAIYENELYPDNEMTLYGSNKRKLSVLQKLMYGFGVMVLLFSAFVSIQSFMTNKQAKDQIATLGQNATKDDQGVTEGTGDEPSEEEISEAALSAYQVKNPNDPRYIRIPELGVLARVKNLGIDKNGAVDAPWNIYDAGWYNGSARPGNSFGSSLVLGHVSGWTGPGVFKNINRLVPGSQFEIEKGNGEKITYSVTKTEQIPLDQVNMAKILGTEVAGQHDMKLMTCSGKYNKETKTYEDRFVVYAEVVK